MSIQRVVTTSSLSVGILMPRPAINNLRLLTSVSVAWFVVNGLSLFYPHSLFWDDWLFYAGGEIDFSEGGTREWCCWPKSEIENFLLSIHPGSFRFLTFLIFPLVALVTWKITSYFDNSFFFKNERLLFVLLVLFLPTNSARIANITFYFSTSLLAFAIATWFWIRLRPYVLLVIAIPLFLYSFRTSSLLVFSLIPALLGWLVDSREKRLDDGPAIVRASIPLLLALVYRVFISDNAVRDGYNEFQFGGVARSVLLLTLFVAIYGALFSVRERLKLSSRALTQFGFGLLLLWLGAMPYMVVGHLSSISDWTVNFLPGEGDWHSRHQLLLPFGIALSMIGVWNLLEGKAMLLLPPVVLAMSAVFGFLYSIEYFVDAKKQDAVVEALRADPYIRDFKVVYLQDDSSAARLNARSRQYREYEFNGQLKRALGDDAPLFFDESQVVPGTCPNPVAVPVYRSFARVTNFTKLQTVFGRSVDISLEQSTVLTCLKSEFRQ